MKQVLLLEDEKGFRDLLVFYLNQKGFHALSLSPLDQQKWRSLENVNVVVASNINYRRYARSLLEELRFKNPFFQVILIFDMEESRRIKELSDPNIFGYFEKPFLYYRDMFLLTVRNAHSFAVLKSRIHQRFL